MKVYTTDAPVDGEFVTGHEVNVEVAGIAAEMHRLDGDNFNPNALPVAKVAAGAWGGLLWDALTNSPTVTHNLGTNAHQVYPIPDGAGLPWRREMTTGDGLLVCTLSAGWQDNLIAVPFLVWIGIRVDGNLIAQSPMGSMMAIRDHALLRGSVHVGAGTHHIEPVYGVAVPYLTGTRDLTWLDRCLSVREVVR